MKYEGAGYYDESTGELLEKSAKLYRECEQGEVWEGNKQAWLDTFRG